MTALVWDQMGERRYETGIDRGVLYLPNDDVVPWNGLVSVAEIRTREVKNYYIDGIQYLAHQVPGSYAARIQAFTYPEELDEFTGLSKFAPGVFLHDQRASQLFDLSYRTRVGNDLEGTDLGYKIHILYNIIASPSDYTHSSLNESATIQPFEWNLVAVPSQMYGIRPTSHVSLDSRTMEPGLLSDLELLIYGSEDADPSLPGLVDLMNLVQSG